MYTKEEDLALMLFVRQNKDFHAIKGNSLYKKAAKAKVCNFHCNTFKYYGYLKKSENSEDLKYFWNMCSYQSIATLFIFEIYRVAVEHLNIML